MEEPTNAMEEVEESGEANLEAKDGNQSGMASLLTKVKVRSIQVGSFKYGLIKNCILIN
jgi:hypothetical protein